MIDITPAEIQVGVLTRMRNRLARPGGWIQGRAHNSDTGGLCIFGALCWASKDLTKQVGYTGQQTTELRTTLLERMGRKAIGFAPQRGSVMRDISAMGWNDRLGRTKAEVLSLIDRTITDYG